MPRFANADCRARRLTWARLVAASLGIFISLPAWGAEPLPPAPQQAGGDRAVPGSLAPTLVDVMLQADGSLRGRIVGAGHQPSWAVAQVPVTFLRDHQPIARVQSDDAGQFAVPNFRGGTYEVLVGDAPLGGRHFCRIWSAIGAPPQASAELTLLREPVVVRGQSLFWAAWPPNATMTALTAGAITGPIVYNNVHHDNRAPTTP